METHSENTFPDASQPIITTKLDIKIVQQHFQGSEPGSPRSIRSRKASDMSILSNGTPKGTPKAKQSNTSPRASSFFGTFLSDPSSPQTDKNGKGRKITVEDINFVDKSKWKNDDKCYVCERGLDKLRGVNPHHCRICGHGVCGDCSHAKINEQRVCDVCWKKEFYKGNEKRRQEKLKEMDGIALDLKEKYDEIHKEASKLKEAYDKDNEETNRMEENRNMFKSKLIQEKEQRLEALKKLKEETSKLQTSIQDENDKLPTMKAKLNQIKLQLAAQKLEIAQKKAVFEKNQVTFKGIKDKKNHNESIYEEYEMKGSSSASRNFSLLDDKDGKYSLSTQPYLI